MPDLLLDLYADRFFNRPQMEAGRSWQWWMERGLIQPFRSLDWSRSLSSQPVWQAWGSLDERQLDAFDSRQIVRDIVGATGVDLLDRLLAPELSRREAVLRYGHGITATFGELGRLLTQISIALDLQAVADDDGFRPHRDDRTTDREARLRRTRFEQPALFAPHRRQPRAFNPQKWATSLPPRGVHLS